MGYRSAIRHLLRKVGYDIIKFDARNAPLVRRLRLLAYYGVDLIFDVGANVGQYGLEMRRASYKGRIVSFEPLTEAFRQLERAVRTDPRWEAVNLGLGYQDMQATLHVAGNSYSSSLLDILPQHIESAPNSSYVGEEEITVRTLDAVFDEYYRGGETAFLKIDTQGYERHVLEGAAASLPRITGVQMELPLVALYAGETSFEDMLRYMADLGYTLMSLEPGFVDPKSGRLLQMDGLFFREVE